MFEYWCIDTMLPTSYIAIIEIQLVHHGSEERENEWRGGVHDAHTIILPSCFLLASFFLDLFLLRTPPLPPPMYVDEMYVDKFINNSSCHNGMSIPT